MKNVSRLDDLLSMYFPLLVAVIACLVLFLAPISAYRWYRQPFIGAFLEPNNVVSRISGPDWPAIDQGASWPDRVVAMNSLPVKNTSEISRRLQATGYLPTTLTLERQDGSTYQVNITPRPVRVNEFISHFGVLYLTGLIFLLSGLWTYWLGGSMRPSRAFLLFTSAVSILTAAFLDMNTAHHFVVLWGVSLPVTAGALVNLALLFPRLSPWIERYPTARYLVWLFTLILCIPVVRDLVAPSSAWAYFNSWGWGYTYIAVAMLIFFASLMQRIFNSRQPVIRQQSRIIIFGALLAFSPILIFYLIPSTLKMGPVFRSAVFIPPLIVLPLSVAYAIVRYRLLDVDRVLSRAVAYGLVTAAAVLLFYLLISVFSRLLQQSLRPDNPLILAVYLLLLVLGVNPLRNMAQRGIDRVFYRGQADYSRILAEISRQLVITPDLTRTLGILERQLSKALNPEHILLFLYEDDRNLYLPYGPDSGLTGPLPPDNPLVGRLSQSEDVLWFPSSQPAAGDRDDSLMPLSETIPLPGHLSCQVFVPLRYEGRLIGFLGLGRRRSGAPYTRDDLDFLLSAAGQSSLAFENARLFNNLQRTLDATREMKNLMDDVFSSVVSGVITTDIERRITLFNQAAERILGVPAVQTVGQPLPDAIPALGAHIEQLIRATIDQGVTTIGKEIASTLPARGPVTVRLSCTPLLDARQETKGAALVIDDLTEQRQLEAERERIRQTFGRVVAPRVRDRLLSEPGSLRLDGVRQTITVMFADIHAFSTYSERHSPEKLLRVVNGYLSLAAQAVFVQEGTLDKFIGDAVMAFWNAPDQQPDHTLRAVRAAFSIIQASAAYRSQAARDEKMYFSIGITCGEAMVGNVGTHELFNYTVLGDVVNLAQRLESVAKPGQILLSEDAYLAAAGSVIANQLPTIKVKGRQQDVAPYELVRLRAQ